MLVVFWIHGTSCWIQLGGPPAQGCLFGVLLEGRPCAPTLRGLEHYGLIFFPVVFGCGLSLCSFTHLCFPRAEQEGCSHCVLQGSNCYLTWWLPLCDADEWVAPYQLQASLQAHAVERGREVSAGFHLFWMGMYKTCSKCIWPSIYAWSISVSMEDLFPETMITRMV